MNKKEPQLTPFSLELEEITGASRATVVSASARAAGPESSVVIPDPEVTERAVRRRFTAEYKRRILRVAEACKGEGQVGALLRREGLYSSHLATWRQQAERGTLDALSPKKRGPKPKKPNPARRRIAELEATVQKLEHKLQQAELIITAQKKISELFQISLDPKGGKNTCN
jgi:transposase-like protein